MLQRRITLGAAVTWSASLLVFVAALLLFEVPPQGWLVEPLMAVGVTALVAPVHELVHGAAFHLLGGSDCKVSFGMKDGFLYTSAHGIILSKARFTIVVLAPSILVSAVLLGLGGALEHPCAFLLAMGLHLGGCMGDLLMALRIFQTKEASFVQDSETGCLLLAVDQ